MPVLLDFTHPHVLRNAAEYEAAVAEVAVLLDADPPPQSVAYERLELLSVLIEAYEDIHVPLDEPVSPQAAVDLMLEQHGLPRTALIPLLGSRSRVSEFYRGRRRLSLGQIQRVRQALGIPADLLLDTDTALPSRLASSP